MISTFHDFVNKIIGQIDGDHADKDDMYEEIMSHLEKSKAQFKKDGFDEKQAGQKAMENFHSPNEIDGRFSK